MSAIVKNIHDDNNHNIENNLSATFMNNLSVADIAEATRIGDALIAKNKLKPSDIEKILKLQIEKKILFGEAAIQLGLVTKHDIENVLAQQFNYSYVRETSSSVSKLLTAAHAPFSNEVENLRSLRSQLMMRWFNQGNKTLAITSCNSQENGHLVAANLAIVFSQLDKKTLLIDANLRQPNQHRLFGVDTKLGLTNILGNQHGSYELTRPKSLPNLAVLAAGTEVPNPQELLSLAAFSSLLSNLENIYDIVLIDTTPLSLASDLLSVASITKAAVVVAKNGVSHASEIQVLLQQLNTTGTNVLGSVFQDQ